SLERARDRLQRRARKVLPQYVQRLPHGRDRHPLSPPRIGDPAVRIPDRDRRSGSRGPLDQPTLLRSRTSGHQAGGAGLQRLPGRAVARVGRRAAALRSGDRRARSGAPPAAADHLHADDHLGLIVAPGAAQRFTALAARTPPAPNVLVPPWPRPPGGPRPKAKCRKYRREFARSGLDFRVPAGVQTVLTVGESAYDAASDRPEPRAFR